MNENEMPESQLPIRSPFASWGISLILHSLMILVLALLISQSQTAETKGEDDGKGSVTELERSVQLVKVQPQYETLTDSSDQSSDSAKSDTTEQVSERADSSPDSSLADALPNVSDNELTDVFNSPTTPQLPGLSPSENFSSASQMTQTLTNQMIGSTGFTEAELQQIRDEQQRIIASQRKTVGPPATVSMFGGSPTTGHRFVFVIDRSKSMGSQGLNALEMAATQLESQLKDLGENHEVQIVAYHHRPVVMGRRALVKMTEEKKQEVPQFLRSLPALGGTDHETAIFAGLSFEPDVLFLLTDGDLPILTTNQLKDIHQHAEGTRIHCIRFGTKEPKSDEPHFMERLAVENGGTYRFINVLEPIWNPR